MAGGKRILIADDDPDISELLEAYFSGQGYNVSVVDNGKDALTKALSEDFDVILLDVMMPYIDGYHVSYEISSKKANSKIIILTSRDVSSEKGIGMLSGASDVIQKPFSIEELGQKVEALVNKGE